MFWILLSAVFGLLAFIYIRSNRIRSKLPPGPPGIPFIGNALQLEAKAYLTMSKWAKQYGDIYTMKIMGSNIVVLNDADSIHKAMVTQSSDFAGRPYSFRIEYFFDFKTDVIFGNPSPRWKVMKKTVIQGLKVYGDGMDRLEQLSNEVITDYIAILDSKINQDYDMSDDLHDAIGNIIITMVYGRRFSPKLVHDLIELDHAASLAFINGGNGFELDVCPWLRFLPSFIYSNLDRMRYVKTLTRKWFPERLHEQNTDSSNVNCVVDFALKRQKELLNTDGTPIMTDKHILNMTMNLILAGVMTTSRVMYAIMMIWVRFPDIQAAARREIDEVVGAKQPKLADRANCPYVESMVLEMMRYISHVPLNVPHETVKDVEINGFTLPKGTTVWTNLWNLHHDERYWDKPWEFVVDRFLDEDRKLVPADHPLRKRLLPFGAGRRVCAGEALAKNRIFLFLATLLQRYEFTPESSGTLPDPDPRRWDVGIVILPQPFKLQIKQRKS